MLEQNDNHDVINDNNDDLFFEVARFVVVNQSSSTNLIMKNFNISYALACEYLNKMIEMGVLYRFEENELPSVIVNTEELEEKIIKYQTEKDDLDKSQNDNTKPPYKKLLINYLVLLISTIGYFVCACFNRFDDVEGEARVIESSAWYLQLFIYISAVICAIGTVALIVTLVKKQLPFSNKIAIRINSILEWFIIFPLCIVISTFCFTFIFAFTSVEGNSMMPTIKNEEKLFLVYGNNFERFDIVVIHVGEEYEYGKSTLFLKRIIGLPGDKIVYEDDAYGQKLKVNGEYVEEYFYNDYRLTSSGGDSSYHKYYDTQTINPIVCDIKKEFTVPEGCYFVLGDNRTNSTDSRTIGFIRAEDIEGEILYRVHSIFNYEKINK